MKTLAFLILLATTFHFPEVKRDKITSRFNCPAIAEDGRCTGSASCSACRNCSRCAHCSNGGTCGVCSGSSGNYDTPSPRKKSNTSQSYYSQPAKVYAKNESFTIYSPLINLREKPNTKSRILEKLTYGDKVSYIKKEGSWIRVQVEKTGTKGYVLAKLLNQ